VLVVEHHLDPVGRGAQRFPIHGPGAPGGRRARLGLDGDGKRQAGRPGVSRQRPGEAREGLSLRSGQVFVIHVDSVGSEPFRQRHERVPVPPAEARIREEAMDELGVLQDGGAGPGDAVVDDRQPDASPVVSSLFGGLLPGRTALIQDRHAFAVEPRREEEDILDRSSGLGDGLEAGVVLPGNEPSSECEQQRGGGRHARSLAPSKRTRRPQTKTQTHVKKHGSYCHPKRNALTTGGLLRKCLAIHFEERGHGIISALRFVSNLRAGGFGPARFSVRPGVSPGRLGGCVHVTKSDE
jgi:hypothetical protein